MTCSDGLDLWLAVGAACVDFGAGQGRIYTWSSEGATGSGLFWGWSVDFLGSSPGSIPLPSSVIKALICSSFFQGQKLTPDSGASCSSSGASTDSIFNSS